MSVTKIFSIDPGLEGGWASLGQRGQFVTAGDLPRFGKLLNGVELSKVMLDCDPEQVVIELAAARPGQGVSSMFRFGCAFGLAIGVANGAGLPLTFVSPAKWKHHFRLSGKPKDASRELAVRLFPESSGYLKRVKDGHRADAILIGRFFLDMEARGEFV